MPIYSFALKINGNDVFSTYGLVVAEIPNNWDSPSVAYPAVQVPGFRGVRRTSAKRVYQPSDYVVKGKQLGTSVSDFESKRDALGADTLADVVIIAGNQPNRQRTGTVTVQYPTLHPSGASAEFVMTIHCEDPVLYATTATTVSGSSGSDLACALGSDDSWPVITIGSPGGSFTLTYKNHAGTTIATAGFTGSGTTWVIDMLRQRTTVDGTRHDEYLTTGDFFALSPVDAVGGSATVRTSAGSISIVYTPAYR